MLPYDDQLLTSGVAFKRMFFKKSPAQCSLHIKHTGATLHDCHWNFSENNESKAASLIHFSQIFSGWTQLKTQKRRISQHVSMLFMPSLCGGGWYDFFVVMVVSHYYKNKMDAPLTLSFCSIGNVREHIWKRKWYEMDVLICSKWGWKWGIIDPHPHGKGKLPHNVD